MQHSIWTFSKWKSTKYILLGLHYIKNVISKTGYTETQNFTDTLEIDLSVMC